MIGVPDGIEHAYAFLQDCAPEEAVREAMRRAVEKYGPQDWARWEFRTEWVSQPPIVRTVYFVWKNGELHRTRMR